MFLLYYDEVKYDPPVQDAYWLGGVCVSHDLVPEIEERINDISERAFGSRLLGKDTEFHGIDVCRGKGRFKGRDQAERMEILQDLLKILSEPNVHKFRIKINPANIVYSSENPADIAFMFFVEAADKFFSDKNELGMLFGDYDEPVIGTSVATLSEFRKGGTRWARAKPITNIIDTVHFAKSHHSRMIQLADVYLYCCQFMRGDNTAPWRKSVAETILGSDILWSATGRDWPSEPRWYR